jgi:hypothetical protein
VKNILNEERKLAQKWYQKGPVQAALAGAVVAGLSEYVNENETLTLIN